MEHPNEHGPNGEAEREQHELYEAGDEQLEPLTMSPVREFHMPSESMAGRNVTSGGTSACSGSTGKPIFTAR